MSTSRVQVQRARGVGNDSLILSELSETVGHSISGEAKVQKYKLTTYILDYRENRKKKTKENFSGLARSRSLQRDRNILRVLMTVEHGRMILLLDATAVRLESVKPTNGCEQRICYEQTFKGKGFEVDSGLHE
jgi:hypothetical protein